MCTFETRRMGDILKKGEGKRTFRTLLTVVSQLEKLKFKDETDGLFCSKEKIVLAKITSPAESQHSLLFVTLRKNPNTWLTTSEPTTNAIQ